MPINLTVVSPSTVGAYAACSQKLVYDSTIGGKFEFNQYADFGTLCHYYTMFKMGLNPRKEPEERLFASAMSLPEFQGQSDERLLEAIDRCADTAIAILNSRVPLPAGVFWIAEHEMADKTLLPTRIGRKGEVKGFSGDIDLLASNREHLIDFKFVSKMPTKCKVEYLWQMGSYHLISGVPKTTLVFVTRDSKYSATIEMDWTFPTMAKFAQQMRNKIAQMAHVEYERYAIPVEGDQCDFCAHKTICVMKKMPSVNLHMAVAKKPSVPVDNSYLAKLARLAAAQKPML